jgi:hypothetical protein
MNNDQLLFMFVHIGEKNFFFFRHTIIGHAHIKPDIILSVIHLAQEGKVFFSSFYVHPIFFSEIKVYMVMMTGASRSQTSELYMGVKHSRQEAIAMERCARLVLFVQ